MSTYVGKRIPRIDALEKVTGKAVYCSDIDLPGMLYGAVLRSPLAHAHIVDLETSAARAVPGVKAVVTGEAFPFIFGTMIRDQPFLAVDRVRYIGEPVAAVAADSEAAAQEAVEKIVARYDALPAVFDPREAIRKGATIIHEKMASYYGAKFYNAVPGTNICTVRKYALGNIDDGFKASDEIFEDEFYIHAVAHTPMETHDGIAQFFEEDGSLTVWSPTDGPHRRAKEISDSLGIPENKVRIISSYSGGGFGGKGNLVAEAVAIALSKFTRGRPVRMVFSREEELTASQTRIGVFIKLTTGVQKKTARLWPERRNCSGTTAHTAPKRPMWQSGEGLRFLDRIEFLTWSCFPGLSTPTRKSAAPTAGMEPHRSPWHVSPKWISLPKSLGWILWRFV